jgi:hypothetical protein
LTSTTLVAPPILQPRLLTPSLCDVLFAAIIALSFLSSPAGWLRLFGDGDAGVHIRLGDLIRSTGHVPSTYPFTFTAPGTAWTAHEWLTEVGLSFVHGVWGLPGTALLAGVVIAATFTLLFQLMLRRGANAGIALLLVLLAVNTNSGHFYVRPHIFTWLLLVCALWLIERDRQEAHWSLWLLVPMTALWANLHGGFTILIALVGLLVVGTALEGRQSWPEAKRYAILGALCLTASLLNPYGWGLHYSITQMMGVKWGLEMNKEFHSPAFHGEAMLIFMALLFLGLALTGRLVRKRDFTSVLWILFLAYSALTSVRHVTIYMLVVTPILAVELSGLWAQLVSQSARTSLWRSLDDICQTFARGAARVSLWPALFLIGLVLAPGVSWPREFPADLFPVTLVARNQERIAAGRVFTTDQWGSYLVYKNYPRQKVFLDAIKDCHNEPYLRDYFAILSGKSGTEELLGKYGIDVVLVPKEHALSEYLQSRSGWREIDQDGDNLLYARATKLVGFNRWFMRGELGVPPDMNEPQVPLL